MEVASIDTVTTGAGVVTANAFTDGFTPATGPFAGVFLPLSQFHFHTPSEHTINGVHYPLEMHMVHKRFTSDGTLTGTRMAANAPGAVMAAAAVIGIMFAFECAPCPHACLLCFALALTRDASHHCSPNDNDGAFMDKMMPIFSKVAVTGPADSTSIDVDSDSDTSEGGTMMFDLNDDVFSIIGTTDYYHYNGSLTTPGAPLPHGCVVMHARCRHVLTRCDGAQQAAARTSTGTTWRTRCSCPLDSW